MIRVLVADDQSLVRAGFKALLDARDDIEVVGEAADGAAAVDLASRLRPDVILMDIRMPGLDGLEATCQIAADPDLAGVRIVILTTFGLDEYLFDALRFGASGFLVKDTEPADLATAVRVVAQGDSLISPSRIRRLVAEFARRAKQPHPAAELDAITQRERELMTLVADGLTNDEIARKLSRWCSSLMRQGLARFSSGWSRTAWARTPRSPASSAVTSGWAVCVRGGLGQELRVGERFEARGGVNVRAHRRSGLVARGVQALLS